MNDQYTKAVHSSIRLSKYPAHINLARELGYQFIGYADVESTDKFVILRHDIDLDLECSLEMAKVEHELSTPATYFIMLHNDLYNAGSVRSRQILREISSLGHTIGLHFDPTVWNSATKEEFTRRIHGEVQLLSEFVGEQVYYVSFHQPSPFALENDFKDEVFESVYNKRFVKDIRYIADSMGMWREESIDELFLSGKSNKIHFLSHPALWFNEEAEILNARLAKLLEDKRRRLSRSLADAINNEERQVVLFKPELDQ